jgi:hypothetical protein
MTSNLKNTQYKTYKNSTTKINNPQTQNLINSTFPVAVAPVGVFFHSHKAQNGWSMKLGSDLRAQQCAC